MAPHLMTFIGLSYDLKETKLRKTVFRWNPDGPSFSYSFHIKCYLFNEKDFMVIYQQYKLEFSYIYKIVFLY